MTTICSRCGTRIADPEVIDAAEAIASALDAVGMTASTLALVPYQAAQLTVQIADQDYLIIVRPA